MALLSPFTPQGLNKTVNIAVSGSNQNLTVPGTVNAQSTNFRLANVGTQTIFLEFGVAGSTPTAATTTSMPMLPNSVETFTGFPGMVIGVIAAATGSTLYVTPGEGI